MLLDILIHCRQQRNENETWAIKNHAVIGTTVYVFNDLNTSIIRIYEAVLNHILGRKDSNE
jgi:hypothetical protein